jgi:hypothetical protein
MITYRLFWPTVAYGVLAACVALVPSAALAQSLTADANPNSGVAGYNDSYLTGSGFPAGTITGATVSLAATCGGTVVATGPVTQVSQAGPIARFEFLIPGVTTTGSPLPAGTYYVTVGGTAGTTAFNTANNFSCSLLNVSVTNPVLAACVPASSLAVTSPSTGNVDAYVPRASWYYSYQTGIERIPLEGSDTTMSYFAGYVNSCAANSVTGEVVCVENNTNVDFINGSTVTTLQSGANTVADFSGGDCENCGITINAQNNTAVLEIGLVGGAPGYGGGSSGIQILNLATNTFKMPVALSHAVSEDISVDPSRNLVLSPGESGYYDLLQVNPSTGAVAEFGQYIGGTLDSAGEDCTTGIALASDEFTSDIYITDLTQASYTSGSPGTWTGAGQFIYLNGDSFAAGTSGMSVAPGSNHYAAVTGEFGGDTYAILQLPSSSGSGTPTLADWAYVATMPSTPDGNPFSAGYDPHTMAAYTSPTTGKSYAVFSDWGSAVGYEYPNYLAVVDMACVLALPRNSKNTVSGDAASCTRYVVVPL